ncbi:hypothetical protein SERLADRAFT_452448 [Serpula lacrymans var. lacrymans S7.9]|uniref:Uncharacterized protein n=1 Tax=Serpula lacrymans var. lacrymans (strain S7.9) TaxID=578457 RepID=F8P7A0_SERL9|nr:uncharacterized protein SERLADRAFT_452448 [Serpula lacrymans var. lacrymans S7.9]EGO21316.1 hypothetical protein SERLADRAFT_452448 [Serpula lacrymans var. lacrymans S7.9]
MDQEILTYFKCRVRTPSVNFWKPTKKIDIESITLDWIATTNLKGVAEFQQPIKSLDKVIGTNLDQDDLHLIVTPDKLSDDEFRRLEWQKDDEARELPLHGLYHRQ